MMADNDILAALEQLDTKDVEHLCVLCEFEKDWVDELLADRNTGLPGKVTAVIEELMEKHGADTYKLLEKKMSVLGLLPLDERSVMDVYQGRGTWRPTENGHDDTAEKKHACIPLCYPANYNWDAGGGTLIKMDDDDDDDSLVVCPDALNLLRGIDGPICPVAVLGPARSGKSYITSQLQEPRPIDCIFRTSKSMDPETKGVWISTSPFKKTLDDGKEVTVILLDTEGFGSHAAYGDSEINIFCLTVLLSSVLIYNSVGVPRGDDLCKFNWVLQLVNAVKIRNQNGTTTEEEFIHFFPNFLWLLRDVQLVPKIDDEEVDVKEYILRKVFQLEPNEKKRVTKQNNEIRTAMLTYFPDFEVYSLPLPSADVDVLGNMDSGFYRESLKLNFVEAVDDFPAATAKTMKAKTAWPFAGCVNGTQFAELLTHYVQSLKSGPVDLLSVWDNVLNTVYHYAVSKAFDHYKAAMLDFVNKESPCHEDVIITEHGKVHQGSLGIFKENTRSIKVATMTETYVQQLVEKIAVYDEMNNAYSTGLLPQLLEINIKRSRAFCRGLARELVESKLRGLDVKKCADDDATFKDIEKVLQEIDEMYDDRASGPQKLEIYEQEIAKAIMRFYNDNIEYLSQLKYFRPPQEAEKIREGELKARAAADAMEKRNSQKKRRRQNQIEKTAVLLAALEDVRGEQKQRTNDTTVIRSVLRQKSQTLGKTHATLIGKIEKIDRQLERKHTVKTDELEKRTCEVENRLRKEEIKLEEDSKKQEEEYSRESEKLKREETDWKKKKSSWHCCCL